MRPPPYPSTVFQEFPIGCPMNGSNHLILRPNHTAHMVRSCTSEIVFSYLLAFKSVISSSTFESSRISPLARRNDVICTDVLMKACLEVLSTGNCNMPSITTFPLTMSITLLKAFSGFLNTLSNCLSANSSILMDSTFSASCGFPAKNCVCLYALLKYVPIWDLPSKKCLSSTVVSSSVFPEHHFNHRSWLKPGINFPVISSCLSARLRTTLIIVPAYDA
jgi:hypothetical protein